jgi:hypothetical protein
MPIRIVEDRVYVRVDISGEVRTSRRVAVDSEGRLHAFSQDGWRIWRPNPGRWTLIEAEARQPGDEELRP